MKVPLLDLKTQNQTLQAELEGAFRRVFQSSQFILGPEVEGFEKSVAELAGARHAIGVSSGTDAILLALMALGIGPGDEVICPSFTFFATAGCVARLGATPVFADSCPGDFNLDCADAARRITSRTRAIIPVHLFGQMADMDAVMQLAKEHRLAVIEDAAQALSATYKDRGAGSIGDFGTYSFFPSKNLGGFGEAGMLVTSDDALAAKARLLRGHGAERRYFHEIVGGNFRIDALQAALLSVKLPHLASYGEARARNAARYSERISAPQPRKAGIVKPCTHAQNRHIWNQYTLRVTPGPDCAGPDGARPENPRDALKAWLTAREIGCEIYYPLPLHLQRCFAVAGKAPASLPVAEKLASEVLSLPVYPELSEPQQDAVIEAVCEFLNS